MTTNSSDRNILILLALILLVPVAFTIVITWDNYPPVLPTATSTLTPASTPTPTATLKPTIPTLTSTATNTPEPTPTPEIDCVPESYAMAMMDSLLYQDSLLNEPVHVVIDYDTNTVTDAWIRAGEYAIFLPREEGLTDVREIVLAEDSAITGYVPTHIFKEECR